ncbi:MAG TPA: sigma-54 dependent transcriptional regulator [Arenicellales bacterium]|nr:sigma-54 dependent transcriptional regulator [Arenicellales bacterium]
MIQSVDTTELMKMASILIVEEDRTVLDRLARHLDRRCAVVKGVAGVDEADELRQRQHFDVIFVSIELSGDSGLSWIASLKSRGLRSEVVFMTENPDLQTALQVIRTGAADLLIKPVRLEQLLKSIEGCLGKESTIRRNDLMKEKVDASRFQDTMIGFSESVMECYRLIGRIAPTRSVVLIEGETGTGKELAARSIHKLSGRGGPFVPLNCVSIPPELFESELFGHIRGAFTGASSDREGLFQHAGQGTIFLDEISEMPLPMQAKLLRVLEEHCVRPVGSNRELPTDARVIAATNRELRAEVAAGRFRQDLFYRLEAVTIRVPPLRERTDDVLALAEHFIDLFARQAGVPAPELERAHLDRLLGYHWPGNIRELKNMMERFVLLGSFPDDLFDREGEAAPSVAAGRFPSDWSLDTVERIHILSVLEACDGNKSEAARRLGVARKTLERKLQRWEQRRSGLEQRLVS